MKKVFFIIIIVLTNVILAEGQQVKLVDYGNSPREIEDTHKFSIGNNPLVSVTDKAYFYINHDLNWRADYALESSYRVNDSIMETYGLKLDYKTTFHKITNVPGRMIEECLDNGIYYIFQYEELTEDAQNDRKKFLKKMDDEERAGYLKSELAKYPGCSVNPILTKEYGNRILVKGTYFDLYHKMWRLGYDYSTFGAKQTLADVAVTSAISKRAQDIPSLIANLEANMLWDRVVVESDGKNYAIIFTTSEGRGAIIAAYMSKGKLMEDLIVPRPEAEFSNFSLTLEASKDVLQMNVTKGETDVKIFPSIGGTNLTKNPDHAIRYLLDFETDTWKKIGKVSLK